MTTPSIYPRSTMKLYVTGETGTLAGLGLSFELKSLTHLLSYAHSRLSNSLVQIHRNRRRYPRNSTVVASPVCTLCLHRHRISNLRATNATPRLAHPSHSLPHSRLKLLQSPPTPLLQLHRPLSVSTAACFLRFFFQTLGFWRFSMLCSVFCWHKALADGFFAGCSGVLFVAVSGVKISLPPRHECKILFDELLDKILRETILETEIKPLGMLRLLASVLPACNPMGNIELAIWASNFMDFLSPIWASNFMDFLSPICWTKMSLALSLFHRMQERDIEPDAVTFVAGLSACSYVGLVDKGLQIFELMESKYKIQPSTEHYCCVVDMLGRVGRVVEAYEYKKKMTSCHVLLSNIYAEEGNWENVDKVRKEMRERGLRKEVGCSWIDTGGYVNRFVSKESAK
ncbi:hypothetical protein Patl1_33176 [Pistacia atlantica]|uniref:Uncharacterized protein n=1 Tax=Pistacia atlantica TaxID=434234 RepID=A0ACC1AQZ9_9ROSI|nr:hypothetical protein Patl1_33176 [Pistacia atlantica]